MLAVLGAITGSVALGWRIIDEIGAFLRISLKVEPPKDGWTTALTAVENKGYRRKRISYAFVLISPEFRRSNRNRTNPREQGGAL